MSGNSKNWQTQPDDIDLLALLERFIVFFRKNKWLFIISCGIGLSLGYLRYLSLPSIYKSRMLLQPLMLSNQNDIQIVANWNDLLRSGNRNVLSPIFAIPDDTLQKLKQIKADEIQKIFTPSNPNGFTIDVWVTDVSILDRVQEGIIYGFENSEFVKNRLASRKNRLRELIDITSTEIKRLDSTKKIFENIIVGKGVSSASLIVDGSTISRQLIEMNEKLLSFKEELKFASSIQVLQGFSNPKRPAGPNLYKWLFLGFISGLTVAYLIGLFRSIDQKLKARAALPKETTITS